MGFMPFGRFRGLPPLFNPNRIKADNIIGGTITAEELIIAGGTQGVIRSQNYDGALGWAIFGDGSSFWGSTAVFAGDIESANWDGASPADLSTRDATATAGLYLDSSVGASQWMGDVFVGGVLNVSDGTNSIILDPPGWSDTNAFITFDVGAGGDNPAIIGFKVASNQVGMTLRGGDDGGTNLGSKISINEQQIKITIGATAGQGSFTFSPTTLDTGTKLILGPFGAQGGPTYSFINDPDTGMYRAGANHLGLSMAKMSWEAIDTTGTAGNVNYNSSTDLVARDTSARKYKSRITYNVDYLADIELRPAKFYRKDDKRWFFSFIADDLGEQHELLGVWDGDEIENYDPKAVMAVMAAKLNRLEAQVAQLLDAC